MIFGADREDILELAARLPRWSLFVNMSAVNYFPEERIAYETEALEEDTAALGLGLHKHLQGFEADRITRMQTDLPQQHYKDRLGASVDEIFFLTQTNQAERFVKSFAQSHGASGNTLPVAVYIQPRVQSSSAHVELTTFWDDSDSGGGLRQAAFHRDASHALSDEGAYFSRPYGIWKDIAYQRDAQIVPHLRRVKDMFDPNAVMNPGKFC